MIVPAHFDVPGSIELGEGTLIEIANGVASNTVAVTVNWGAVPHRITVKTL